MRSIAPASHQTIARVSSGLGVRFARGNVTRPSSTIVGRSSARSRHLCVTKSETAPLRAGGRWALGLWIYRSRLIVYPGYTYILRIVTRHMVMCPGMYTHTRVCTLTPGRGYTYQCDSHDLHVNARHHTGGVVIAKTEGPNSARSRPRRPSPRETRRTFVTGVRVREAVRGSRASAIPVDRAREKETRTKPTVDGTDARTSNARSHR